jgi:lipopolysaccharide biosynthesis protein
MTLTTDPKPFEMLPCRAGPSASRQSIAAIESAIGRLEAAAAADLGMASRLAATMQRAEHEAAMRRLRAASALHAAAAAERTLLADRMVVGAYDALAALADLREAVAELPRAHCGYVVLYALCLAAGDLLAST